MPDPNQPEVILNSPPTFQLPLKLIGQALAILLVILLLVLLLAPLELYLNLNSLLYPHALTINNTPITWDLFKKEVKLAGLDKSLKTRQQKLEAAMDQTVELQILRASVATPSARPAPTSLFTEHQLLKEYIEQNLVNSRTGGYFIARFNIPQATESAELIQTKAKTEIVKLQEGLSKGKDFKKLLEETNQNTILEQLNQGSFLPGMYLDKITSQQFPVKIKGFREQFFSLNEGQVSDIMTLSWDDYDGPSDGRKATGEFAYAVLRVDQVNPQSFSSFEEWLRVQKQKVKFESNVLIPFYFGWL